MNEPCEPLSYVQILVSVTKHMKICNLYMEENTIGEDERFMVFEFLTRFIEEVYIIGMNEAQAYLDMPHFVSGTANQAVGATRELSSSSIGGVTCCPEVVQ